MERESKNNIAGAIILYNPDDLDRLNKCIDSVLNQVEHLYVFDNSTKEINLKPNNKITFKFGNGNKGIAYALNRLIEAAQKDGYSWVLTVDQDSIVPDGMINDFKQYMNDDNIGIICPQVIDRRRAYMSITDSSDSIKQIEMCITSASCTSVKAWQNVGKFDEWLFIDLVDNDFCKRLRISGYKIIQVSKWILDQEFGKITPKAKNAQSFWIALSKFLHNKNIAKFSYTKEVSPIRVFYTCRNIIYVNKKLKLYGKTAYENYNCRCYPGFIISFILPSILRAKKKSAVLKAVINGTIEGIKSNPKVISVNIKRD